MSSAHARPITTVAPLLCHVHSTPFPVPIRKHFSLSRTTPDRSTCIVGSPICHENHIHKRNFTTLFNPPASVICLCFSLTSSTLSGPYIHVLAIMPSSCLLRSEPICPSLPPTMLSPAVWDPRFMHYRCRLQGSHTSLCTLSLFLPGLALQTSPDPCDPSPLPSAVSIILGLPRCSLQCMSTMMSSSASSPSSHAVSIASPPAPCFLFCRLTWSTNSLVNVTR